ncbi:outer membrane lipid asymmetry maintenance protein MlaD [Dissulfurirhabdus thermomarina]|uniref:Outer membrane lipid asymmetry maintenance protein MlaD n=1 Tax=Dissulfurirhabdus thermomarina TaxID=1765737 RepID=A0A6N9TT92_DISTH|nr:outer membrane lipid asymmetry maintenance protein MlaD [Dissulfurirhabdus thermomarina]NDY42964.1 outer membrane lipid asymmetry maintenance protein MlaD [Dissulfurirhabdus thermomarina]NMX24322.1 outer membrane lipid asymmetry maintenance protein MlaD [Dissulfurirhabdus thermomarina]
MKRFNLETVVGLFLVAGFACLAYLAVRLGDVGLFRDESYPVVARFTSVSGLKKDATVEIAGVPVGNVADIRLDPDRFEAVVRLRIRKGVPLQEDCIASIRTAGIIGDRFVEIKPGGSPDLIPPGGEIMETESAVNLEELISKYVFEK